MRDKIPGEIRLRPNITDSDMQHKIAQAKNILQGGAKIRVVVIFRGREVISQRGYSVLQTVAEHLAGIGQIESQPHRERRRLVMEIGPSPHTPEEPAPVGAKPKPRPPTLSNSVEVIMWKKIIVQPVTHARLMKIKKEEGRRSLDVVLNRLLDAAEEAKRQGINLVK